MTALLQFLNVSNNKFSSLSFSIDAGEARVLKVVSQETKIAVMEMALGEVVPAAGEVLLLGQPLQAARRGSIGWIPGEGGLISNLKTWENVTLPLWYHNSRQLLATEDSAARWLAELGLEQQEWERFMSSPAARLRPAERKLAGLLRGLLQVPQLLVIDAALFDEVEITRAKKWIVALEKFVHETNDRAVLVVANAATLLPWEIIE